MGIISQEKARNYLPLDVKTRLSCCQRRANSGWSVKKICSYYHVSRQSLWRWMARFDGSEGSLACLSHRPHSECGWKTPEKTARKIECLANRRKRDNLSSVDIWLKALSAGCGISYSTCLRILKRLDGYEPYSTNPKKKHNGKYNTPEDVGEKWQMDVKFVPCECKSPKLPGCQRYYQYTVLDEASRKRFLYFAAEHSMYEARNALEKAIAFFGYAPKVLQTDNGSEFSDKAFRGEGSRYGRRYPNALEPFLAAHGIRHQFIRPRTPEHNGKVERSHRIDQEKFYRTLRFYSLDDLRKQGKAWMDRYNSTPRMVLRLKSPNQAELDSLRRIMENTGEVRCPRLLKCFTSIEN